MKIKKFLFDTSCSFISYIEKSFLETYPTYILPEVTHSLPVNTS